ncbi:NAD-dependent epimerase/dehydratase family protein [Crocinitomix sp.]|nr:NAD-dependent epimerase/dehydratase family protein [Crocinitomix sp.]
MHKILVTGGAGNIGSALVEGILKLKNYKVVIVDNLSTGDLDKIPIDHPNLTFIKADVNNLDEISPIMISNRFDYVFHYAAYVGVQRTQEHPICVMNDIDGIKNVLSLSKNTGVKRFFFSSSSEVYGEPVTIPQHEETTPLNSRLPYAVVKNVGEAFCKSYFQEFGLEYTIFRFFNTYGPNQTQDFVMSKFIHQALKNEPITIYGDGSQTRTFCFVKDNIDATILAWKNDLYVNDVINIGGATVITILELAELIISITKSESKIEFLPPLKDGDMTRRQPDNSKMIKILNRDLITMEEGIKILINDERFLPK